MATVGSLKINLGLSSAAFTAGIAKARGTLKSFTDFIGSTKGALTGLFAVAGIGMGISAIKSLVGAQMEAIDTSYKLATALKMPTEALMGLGAMARTEANMSAEDLATTLQKLSSNLGEAAMNGGPVSDALQRLGLDAQALTSQGLDKSFMDIAQKISEIANPMERSRLAVEVFGKSGQKLMPMFEEGASGIQAAIDKAKQFGTALTDMDAAKVSAAKQGFEELGERVEGVKNTLIVALAPALIDIADRITALAPTAQFMAIFFVESLHIVATGVAMLMDAFTVLKTGVLAVCTGLAAALFGLVWAVQKLGEGIAWVVGKLSGTKVEMPEISSDFKVFMKSLAEDTATAAGEIGNAQRAVDSFFDGINFKADATAKAMNAKKNNFVQPITEAFAEGRKKIDEMLDGMKHDIDTWGLGDIDKKLFDLLHNPAATNEQKERAKVLADQLETLEAQRKNLEESQQLWKEFQSPMDAFKQRMQYLNEHRLDIGEETFLKAAAAARKNLQEALGFDGETKLSNVTEQRFAFNYNAQRQAVDPTLDVAKQQLEQQKQIAKDNKRTADWLEKNGMKEVGI